MTDDDLHGYRTVRIPGNIEKEDQIIGSLTMRQAAVIGGTAAVLWCLWMVVRAWVPTLLFLAPAMLVLFAAGLSVSVNRDGVSVDRLLLAGLKQAVCSRRQVLAPEGVQQPPAFITAKTRGGTKPPVPMDLRVRAVTESGTIRLGPDGVSSLAEASTVNFALRTHSEQEVLIGGFARWLNTLTGPVQIVSRTTPADLGRQVELLRERAGGLPHPLLERAALDHADFLAGLAARRTLMDHKVLIATHELDTKAEQRLLRRAHDTAAVLAGCELNVTVLDPTTATDVLGAALDPDRSTTGTGAAR
ncbi:PrgI family protein [Catenulispora sp. NL8]|uniref:PrgI family protein n=1 Tax=Catenulispora pinistramenti TaxID=2705254 RepID=A0ABS5KGR7_9ACTN|nr:PrgI family protein [Catenulispora pinistramenti]MBS2545399.1 PrgI family protein [Catenulispora pinistramenti]